MILSRDILGLPLGSIGVRQDELVVFNAIAKLSGSSEG